MLTSADETIFHSSDFKLIKDPASGFVYCCKLDESLDHRIQEKRMQLKKPPGKGGEEQ